MKFLQETNDKKFSLPKHKAKTTEPEKQSVVSQKQSVVYTSFQIKTEFKEIKERENAHKCLYWFTLNPKLHPVFSETTEEFH